MHQIINSVQTNIHYFLLNQQEIVTFLKHVFSDFPEVMAVIKSYDDKARAESMMHKSSSTNVETLLVDIVGRSTGWTEEECRT